MAVAQKRCPARCHTMSLAPDKPSQRDPLSGVSFCGSSLISVFSLQFRVVILRASDHHRAGCAVAGFISAVG